MTTFCIEIMPHPFSAIWDGEKKYEIQKEQGFSVGDVLDLRECQAPDPLDLKIEGRTGRRILAKVIYKTPGGNFSLPMTLCVLGLDPYAFHEGLFDDVPAINPLEVEVASDVDIVRCRCGGQLRFSGRGEKIDESLRYAMHTKPACEAFESHMRRIILQFAHHESPEDSLKRFAEHQAKRDRIKEWDDYAKKTVLRLYGKAREIAMSWLLVELSNFPRNMPYSVKWGEKFYRLTMIVPGEIRCDEIVDGLRDYERAAPPWEIMVKGSVQ